MKQLKITAMLVALALLAGGARGADNDGPAVKVETVCRDFQRPSGVAVHPSTGHVYVTDAGTGRVVRLRSDKLDEPVTAIEGFVVVDGKSAPFAAGGPSALVFLHQNLIIVGSDDADSDRSALFVFDPPEDAAMPLKMDQARQTLRLGEIKNTWKSPVDRIRGLAIAPTNLWIAAADEDQGGALLMAGVMGTKLDGYHTFAPNRDANRLESPACIAFHFSKDFVVVGQMGTLGDPADSSLAFVHTASGALMMELPVELRDLVGLAYSPTSHRLYAIDLSWSSPKQGGLYRLDSAVTNGRASVKPTKLAELDRPTAMAFAPDNSLYITTLGGDDAGDKADDETGEAKQLPRGSLIKVTGEL